MNRRSSGLLCCLLIASITGFGQENSGAQARGPAGIYVRVALDAVASEAYATAYTGQGTKPHYLLPALREDPTNEVIVSYFLTLLDDTNVSGLAVEIPWDFINPNNPGSDPEHPAANAYIWKPLDDAFAAVDQWNTNNPTATPKTIQLLVSPGFHSPPWLWTAIDDGADGCVKESSKSVCEGNCDGLFVKPKPADQSFGNCGYTSIFYKTEGAPIERIPLPLPWNPTYKAAFGAFLVALNNRIQHEQSSSAFVSISIAGPTSSSTEMILPNDSNQAVPTKKTGGYLTLTPKALKAVGKDETTVKDLSVSDAWNFLLENSFGESSDFYNSDGAFIQEWDNAIDLYGTVFSGITLSLTTTTDNLPTFAVPPDSALLQPAAGFGSDCNDLSSPPPNLTNAMACAAVTQVLTYFVNPTVGGNNAKATQENGLTASKDGSDLGPNGMDGHDLGPDGIKWLAATTANGTAPLPGTAYNMSPVLGGFQAGKAFSSETYIQLEGCPTYLEKIPCEGLTPSLALSNVLKYSFFPGTFYAPAYGASQTVDVANFDYTDAPLNFVQFYDNDILYAEGLSKCSMYQITGSPAFNIKPRLDKCEAKPPTALYVDSQNTNEELEDASVYLLRIAEPIP
jgi:hypothetical protein